MPLSAANLIITWLHMDFLIEPRIKQNDWLNCAHLDVELLVFHLKYLFTIEMQARKNPCFSKWRG